jgi:hypothetical protein
MKTSELITQLQRLLQEHGDVPVVIAEGDNVFHWEGYHIKDVLYRSGSDTILLHGSDPC